MSFFKNILAYYRHRAAVTLMYHHGILFVVCAGAAIWSRLAWAPEFPIFWVLGIWYLIFSLHFLLLRSLGANNEWADDRADKLRRQAYDFSHVKDIYVKPITLKTPYVPPSEAFLESQRKLAEQSGQTGHTGKSDDKTK
ncbi:MAG: hypothetical protein OSB58_05745 [Alphaproteobacteria bacterium]|jgi:hypothetical protein|nr:hypothetical protein [Alphaproteobacteria bacterium]